MYETSLLSCYQPNRIGKSFQISHSTLLNERKVTKDRMSSNARITAGCHPVSTLMLDRSIFPSCFENYPSSL